MHLPNTSNKHRNVMYLAAALALLTSMLGCNQPADDGGARTSVEPPPVADPQVQQIGEAAPAADSSDRAPSFKDYSLPIPCRRTSDARETTPGGKYKNVIVFACRSHDAAVAVEEIRAHMLENGYAATQETAAESTTLVLRKQGTYKTTLRVSPDKKTDPETRSTVRVQWFSND